MAPARRGRGCRLYVAAAGYGKTTAAEAAHTGAVARFAAGDFTGIHAATDHVIIDGVEDLTTNTVRRLAAALADVSDHVRVSLCSRRPVPPRVRAALPGPVTEQTAADLALGPEAVARLLREEHGIVSADLAYLVHELTAGWPALVQFAGDALESAAARPTAGGDDVGSPRRDLVDALSAPGSPCATWLREEALSGLPAPAAQLLRRLADLDPLSASLCAAIAGDNTPDRAEASLRLLAETGLLTPAPDLVTTESGVDGWIRMVPLLAATLRRSSGRPVGQIGRLRAAAAWYAGHGQPLAAANALRRCGDLTGWRQLVRAQGDEILAAGGATDLVAGLEEALADPSEAPHLFRWRLLLGDASRMAGDPAGAWRVFAPMLATAEAAGCLPAALGWRAAMVHYMRSDYLAAWELCAQVSCEGQSAPDPDTVFLSACRTSVLAMRGETEPANASAAYGLEVAAAVGDDRALAAAHIAGALTAWGVRRDEQLALALAAAGRAGDVVQQARVLLNQADGLLREARYAPALALATRAVRAARAGSPPGLLAVALSNAGEAALRLGRFDEATLSFDRAVLISRRVGRNRTAMGLWGLAEIDRLLGRRELSRGGFEEAADLARSVGDHQVLVPALSGLTRVLLDDGALDAARAAADEAETLAASLPSPRGPVARGWVALAEGDLAGAQQRAAAAVAASRATRRADALAESLELAAAVATDSQEARSILDEAEGIWRRAGAEPAADRMLLLLGQLPGSDSTRRAAAKAAADRLRALGVAVGATEAASASVRIRVLGRFEVFVGGKPVPLTAWRSRQARSLLKILIGRRGSPVARGELSGLLWPDDDAHRTGHRLSVLLSAVRCVLDPSRLWPVDHHLRADIAGICLDTEHVVVDVEDLIRDATQATALLRDNDISRARDILSEVDAMYLGDAFSDEPYEDWSAGLREQARTVWLGALRTLADLSRTAHDVEGAVTYLVRLLAADPFDETGHAALVDLLVRAGRHGEARRAFDRWTTAMKTIDAPPPDQRRLRPVLQRSSSSQHARPS